MLNKAIGFDVKNFILISFFYQPIASQPHDDGGVLVEPVPIFWAYQFTDVCDGTLNFTFDKSVPVLE
ncbi:hypothetical protein PYX06_22695 [Citrobacter amalonaticus]|nr:hypothetical protein [Citrobacter amalonaticus]